MIDLRVSQTSFRLGRNKVHTFTFTLLVPQNVTISLFVSGSPLQDGGRELKILNSTEIKAVEEGLFSETPLSRVKDGERE